MNQQFRDLAAERIGIEAAAVQAVAAVFDDVTDQIIALLYECSGKVFVTGSGTSGTIARRMAHLFSVCGTPSVYIQPSDALHGTMGALREGDVLIGVKSSGVHSNGYSLVRKVVETSGLAWDAPAPFAPGMALGEALLTPTRLYVRCTLAALHTGGIKGLAHITGGGVTDNLPRALPDGLDAEVDLGSWQPLPVFGWLAKTAGIAEREMLRTFNCGIGLVAVVAAEQAGHVIDAFQECGDKAVRIGHLIRGEGETKVVYRGALKL